MRQFKFKKVALINGRGIAGCGDVQHLHQLEDYFASHEVDHTVYASIDRKFSKSTQDEDTVDWVKFKFANEDEVIKHKENIDKADLVLITGLPERGEKEIENFYKYFINGLPKTTTVVLLVVDHSKASLRRNPRWQEAVNRADIHAVHALTGDVSKAFVADGTIVPKPTIMTPCSFDFEDQKTLYWKSVESKEPKSFGWLGRLTIAKKPDMVYKIHNSALKEDGWVSTLEGCEFDSPSALKYTFINSKDHPLTRKFGPLPDICNCIPVAKGKPRPYTVDTYNDALDKKEYAILLPTYKRIEGLERMSNKLFGSNFYSLMDYQYGGSLECAHAEIVCAGVIPIFHRHHGICTTNFRTMKSHYDKLLTLKENMEITGTIWADYANTDEVSELMLELSKDKVYYEKIRNKAFEYWKHCYDREYIFGMFMDSIDEYIDQKEKDLIPDLAGFSPISTLRIVKEQKILLRHVTNDTLTDELF